MGAQELKHQDTEIAKMHGACSGQAGLLSEAQ
jgi:hypothetical protein